MNDAEDLEFEFIPEADDAASPQNQGGPKAADQPPVSEDEPAEADAASPEFTEEEAAEGESIAQPHTEMGVRFVVRSAEGTKVINTIDVSLPFEPSV